MARIGHSERLSGMRFAISFALIVSLVVLTVRAVSQLFLAPGSPGLLALCLIEAALAIPLLVWPCPDWISWLIVQAAGIMAATRLADSHVELAAALNQLPSGPLTITLPAGAPFHGLSVTVGPQHAVWGLLMLLGMLTWELTWGLLWLTLRAAYSWAALFMAGATMLTIAQVAPSQEGLFPLFMVLALALALWQTWSGRLLYAAGQAPALHPRLSAGASLLGGLCTVAVVVPMAWAAPPPGVALQRWAQQSWAQILAHVRPPLGLLPRSSSVTLSTDGFGTALRMDGPFRPVAGLIFRARGIPPTIQPYWRGLVYDAYRDHSWQVSAASRELAPGGVTLPADVPRHPKRRVTVTVTVLQPTDGLIFAPGRPIAVDRATSAYLPPAGSGAEPAAVYSQPPPVAGSYAVTAELPAPMPRRAAAGPPAAARYLALPPDTDPALMALAMRLTAGLHGELARALAIQSFLRAPPFTYDAETGPAPAGQDPVAYFVLISHRGYCVHFASAMALLARAAGLPSRVVGGYATGIRDGDSWVVAGHDAHTWPEIFFAGSGWVPFEPTPGYATPGVPTGAAGTIVAAQPPAIRPIPTAAPTQQPTPAPVPVTAAAGSRAPSLLLPGLLLAAAISAGSVAARRRGRPSIAHIYGRMSASARWLVGGPRAWQTPGEFAQSFAGRSADEFGDVQQIASLYAAACYGRVQPSADELRRATLALRRLRRRWLARRLRPGSS